MSKRQAIILSVFLVMIFTDILFCAGVFGSDMGIMFRHASIIIAKWMGIIIGYLLCIIVPSRIAFLLNKRSEVKYEISKEEEYRRVTEQNNELIRKIEESYYNPKDEI